MLATKPLTQISAWSLDKGMKRDKNEDSLSITEVLQTGNEEYFPMGIYAVADGIGGMAHGERASRLAVQVANQVILQEAQYGSKSPDFAHVYLETAMQTAHRMIQNLNSNLPSYEVSGTTLVLALVTDNWLHIANIGDSRAYIVAENEIRQVSQDHTFVNSLVEAGVIRKEDAMKSPHRHTLTQALGSREGIKPMLRSEILFPGDYLLLCSDGLYSELSNEEIYEIIKTASSPSLACHELMTAANAAGGKDNIAVILVQMQASE